MTEITAFWTAIYIAMLAAFTGYVVISRVPAILHTPLMSGSNFIHGIVLVGAMVALGLATTPIEQAIGFIAVVLGAANVTGGYVVTERILQMFDRSGKKSEQGGVTWLTSPLPSSPYTLRRSSSSSSACSG